MNFEKWFNKSYKDYNFPETLSIENARFAWNACKEEVLTILNKYKFDSNTEFQHAPVEVIDLDAIEEIKKI